MNTPLTTMQRLMNEEPFTLKSPNNNYDFSSIYRFKNFGDKSDLDFLLQYSSYKSIEEFEKAEIIEYKNTFRIKEIYEEYFIISKVGFLINTEELVPTSILIFISDLIASKTLNPKVN